MDDTKQLIKDLRDDYKKILSHKEDKYNTKYLKYNYCYMLELSFQKIIQRDFINTTNTYNLKKDIIDGIPKLKRSILERLFK